MSTFDVRNGENEVKEIIFSSGDNSTREFYVGNSLTKAHHWNDAIEINDPDGASILIEGKGSGLNLIKAIEKAISLGWLK